MSTWQPIDTAPKDGTHILLYCEDFMIEGWWHPASHIHRWDFANLDIHGCGCCGGMSDPTHWAPLPEPPK